MAPQSNVRFWPNAVMSVSDPKRTYISRTGNSENKNNDLPLFQGVDDFTF